SPKMRDLVKKVVNKCETVKYCIEMYSDEGFDERDKRFVGFNYVKDEGRVFTLWGTTASWKRILTLKNSQCLFLQAVLLLPPRV
ncbi:MAG: hypothetical protein IKM19_04775, partial [Firmicutes bacterium]|nr:hypothetical protein [Bacillota bacterium]